MYCPMKKILYSSFAVLVAATVLASCNKEVNLVETSEEDLIEITLIADNPTPDTETKTEIYSGAPYWSPGDVIGVSTGTDKNYKFPSTIASRATTASFTGSTSVSGDQYAYYPYSSFGASASGMKVEMPAKQFPTSDSFDGSADVMFSKKFNVDPASKTVTGLEFARAGAIVKIVFVDNTTGTVLTGEHLNEVKLSSSVANLAGKFYLDLVGQSVGDFYADAGKSVTAYYTPSTQFAIDGTNGAFIIVSPQTLATGTDNLTITAKTETHAISKTVSIPAAGIKLDPGKITTLQVAVGDAHVSASSGAALPFEDDFAWQTAPGSEFAITDYTTPALPYVKYISCERVYTTTTAGEVRIGTSSNSGSLTTVSLDLSAESHITVNAKQYGSDNTKIVVSVDGGEPIEATNDGTVLGGSYKAYIFNLPASTANSRVTITTSSAKRAYVNNILIETGSYVPPATPKELPYENSLISSHTDFAIDNVSTGSLENIWTDSSYGAQASAYGTTSDVETYLVSPKIDLSGVTNAVLTFDHTVNFFADVATARTQTALQIKVGDGEWAAVTIPTYPATLSNTAVHNIVPLDTYCGNVVQFRFKYLATSTNPGRWQIKNFLVKEATHSVSATPNPAVIGGTAGNSTVVTATSDYEVTFSTTGSGFTVAQNGKIFTLTANNDGGASEANLGSLIIKEVGDADVNTVITVKQEAKVSGTSVTLSIADYADAHSWTNGTAYTAITITTGITMSINADGNNGKYYESNESWRAYEGNSANITLNATGGKKLQSVTFTYDKGNNGAIVYNETNYSSGTTISLSGTSATFTVTHTSGSSKGNVQIKSVTVVYSE